MKRFWVGVDPIFRKSQYRLKNRYVLNFTLLDIHVENADNFVEVVLVLSNIIFHYLRSKKTI